MKQIPNIRKSDFDGKTHCNTFGYPDHAYHHYPYMGNGERPFVIPLNYRATTMPKHNNYENAHVSAGDFFLTLGHNLKLRITLPLY